MKVLFLTLVLFLLAFAGLAIGLALKRKGVQGGCRLPSESERTCRCQSPSTVRNPVSGSAASSRGTGAGKNQGDSQTNSYDE